MENAALINCASGNPTSGRYDVGGDPLTDIDAITLTNTVADVFVSAAAGDFRLVQDAAKPTGGFALWSTGIGFPGQIDTDRDISPLQHAYPPAAEVLDTCDEMTGTYHEATVAEVQDGVFFGPASAYEGEYAGGGGAPVFGGHVSRRV